MDCLTKIRARILSGGGESHKIQGGLAALPNTYYQFKGNLPLVGANLPLAHIPRGDLPATIGRESEIFTSLIPMIRNPLLFDEIKPPVGGIYLLWIYVVD